MTYCVKEPIAMCPRHIGDTKPITVTPSGSITLSDYYWTLTAQMGAIDPNGATLFSLVGVVDDVAGTVTFTPSEANAATYTADQVALYEITGRLTDVSGDIKIRVHASQKILDSMVYPTS